MSLNLAVEEFLDTVVETSEAIDKEKGEVDRVIGTIEALEHLQDWFENKETISLEDINVLDAAVVFSRQDKDGDFNLLPEVSEGQSVNIVLESISDSILNGVASLAKSSTIISALIKKRWVGYSALIAALQGDLERIGDSLKGKKSSDKVVVNVSFPISRSYAYRNSAELLKKLNEDLDNMADVIERFNVCSESMQGMVMKTIGSMTSSNRYDKVLVENFNVIKRDFVDSIMKSKIFQGSQNLSKPVLGDRAIRANAPEEELVVGQSRSSIRRSIALFDLRVVKHSDEIGHDVVNDDIDLIVTVGDLNALVSKMRKLYATMDDYRRKGNHYLDTNRNSFDVILKFLTAFSVGQNYGAIYAATKRVTALMKAFEIKSPAAYASIKAFAVGAAVTSTVVNVVVYKALTALRKFIIGWIFTSMKLQYKVTSLIEEFDRGVIKTAVLSFNNSAKVCNKAIKKL